MLTSLQISGFRAFESLKVEPLSRVNLFVGANNAGKTSVLEAVESLCEGTPNALLRGPLRREERGFDGHEATELSKDLDVRHLFHGRLLNPSTTISLRGVAREQPVFLRCEVVDLSSEEEQAHSLSIQSTRVEKARLRHLSSSGGIKPPEDVDLLALGTSFMGAEVPSSQRLRAGWDSIVLTPEEDRVVEALRIIEPRVERVAFSMSRHEGGIFVRLAGEEGRIPLGSMGEGMKRLLSLSIKLARAPNGLLLVDDIDTGLHYSVMVSMWRLVVETAKRLDLQVFATTHSLDCVRALGWLYESSLELASDVTVHRIEKGQPATTMYSAEELLVAARQHMEIR